MGPSYFIKTNLGSLLSYLEDHMEEKIILWKISQFKKKLNWLLNRSNILPLLILGDFYLFIIDQPFEIWIEKIFFFKILVIDQQKSTRMRIFREILLHSKLKIWNHLEIPFRKKTLKNSIDEKKIMKFFQPALWRERKNFLWKKYWIIFVKEKNWMDFLHLKKKTRTANILHKNWILFIPGFIIGKLWKFTPFLR